MGKLICEPEWEPPPDTTLLVPWPGDFPASGTMKNKGCHLWASRLKTSCYSQLNSPHHHGRIGKQFLILSSLTFCFVVNYLYLQSMGYWLIYDNSLPCCDQVIMFCFLRFSLSPLLQSTELPNFLCFPSVTDTTEDVFIFTYLTHIVDHTF